MYLTLKQVKKHLNIDECFKEDDSYLESLISVAEEVVKVHIDDDLSGICSENGGDLPAPILHAMLLYIGNLYQSRESNSFAGITQVPFSFDYIMALYKNYKKR